MSNKSVSRENPSKKSVSGGKKHPVRTRRLAGKTVMPPDLSPAQTRIFSGAFAAWPCKGDNPLSPVGVSAATMRKRETAARLSWSFFRERFVKSYPEEEIAGALAAAVSFPVRFTEWFTEPDFLCLGAAYWMLDRLGSDERLDELDPLLPVGKKEEDDLLPFIMDLTHSRRRVNQLVQLIRERKTRPEVFRKVAELLGEENIAPCRAAFCEALTDYFARFLEVRTRIHPVSEEPSEKVPFSLSPVPTANRLFDQSSAAQSRVFTEKDSWKWPPDLHFLWMTPNLIGVSEEKIKDALRYRRMIDLMSGFTVRDPYEICAAWVLMEAENDLLTELNTLTSAVVICAERHLPWYYEEGEMCLFPAHDRTPDYRMKYLFNPPEKPSEEEELSGTDDLSPPEKEKIPSLETEKTLSPEEEKIVSPETEKVVSPEEEQIHPYIWEAEAGSMIDRGSLLSEAQLFYLVTGYLLPRDCDDRPRLETWFVRQGISPERAKELSFGASLLAHMWDEDLWSWEDYLSGGSDAADESGTVSDRSESGSEQSDSGTDTDTKKIADLTRQLKATQQALHDAELMVRQVQERSLEAEKQSARDRMELRGLRDTLFRMRTEEEALEQETTDNEVEFPWPVKRRVLVFGGHDTWSKAIRPLLPGVRFFDREALPDLKAIKGANAVWIQSNALSHKFYYRIIDTARRENIPVLYFGFASARKCAEQLVAYELETENNS